MTAPTLPPEPIPRLHLFEFNDQPWLPEVLRRICTDYLRTVLALTRPFAPLAPRLAALLAHAGSAALVDLCSGGAGPYPWLLDEVARSLGRDVTVRLTDCFPNLPAFERAAQAAPGRVTYEREPVDARAVPERLAGVRTMFNAFHHFRPAEARAILADAHRRRAPILIAEVVSRTPKNLLAMPLLGPLLVLLVTPAIRPLSLWRLALTYAVPVAPPLIAFDGLVSSLRAYRPAELRALAAGLDEGYRWEAGELTHKGQRVTYLIGEPA